MKSRGVVWFKRRCDEACRGFSIVCTHRVAERDAVSEHGVQLSTDFQPRSSASDSRVTLVDVLVHHFGSDWNFLNYSVMVHTFMFPSGGTATIVVIHIQDLWPKTCRADDNLHWLQSAMITSAVFFDLTVKTPLKSFLWWPTRFLLSVTQQTDVTEMILPETIADSMRQKHCSDMLRLITEVTETQEKLSDMTEIANTGSFI